MTEHKKEIIDVFDLPENILSTPKDVIKNPARKIPKFQKPYEPEYQRLGKDPKSISGTGTRVNVIASKPEPIKDHPSQEEDVSVSSFGDEHYDSLGRQISIENGMMIDNNDFIELGPYEPRLSAKKSPVVDAGGEKNPATTPQEGNFILMVLNKTVIVGSKSEVEEKVKNILYGEDLEYKGVVVNLDDIVVLKRLSIKTGIFVSE
jgi:hypothetical protein